MWQTWVMLLLGQGIVWLYWFREMWQKPYVCWCLTCLVVTSETNARRQRCLDVALSQRVNGWQGCSRASSTHKPDLRYMSENLEYNLNTYKLNQMHCFSDKPYNMACLNNEEDSEGGLPGWYNCLTLILMLRKADRTSKVRPGMNHRGWQRLQRRMPITWPSKLYHNP